MHPETQEQITIQASQFDSNDRILLSQEQTDFFVGMHPLQPLVRVDGFDTDYTQCAANTPIGIDLDGSGRVERMRNDVDIDISGDGHVAHLFQWFAPTEGILLDALLAMQDGVISDGHFVGAAENSRRLRKFSGAVTGRHLFGDMGSFFADGFEKLSVLDANKDGSVQGAELAGLAVWVDANSNAIVDVGELNALASYGIVRLSTTHDDYVSSAQLADGSVMVTEDLWFMH